MAICRICQPIPCDNPADLAAGIDGALYSALDYSFQVTCPDKCFCPPGLFPQTISILASIIPPVIPPINEPGFTIILRLQGCSALITRTLAAGSTQAQIAAAAQSMQAEWAGQQALCNALLVPGVNCNTGDTIDVCNDARTICCPGSGLKTIAAGTFCQTLNITGLTQSQIDSQTAAIKAKLNALAASQICPGFGTFCSIIESTTSPGGQGVSIILHNQSATDTFDSSTIQYGDISGTPIFTSLVPSVGPLAFSVLISFSGPLGLNPFTVLYKGQVIFKDTHSAAGFDREIDLFVGCSVPPPC